MIRAVVFDCFGVLSTDGWKQIREEFFAHDDKLMRRALEIDKAVNSGYMRMNDFLAEIAQMSGLSLSEVQERINGNSPNNLLLAYIHDSLKRDYKIGMLSNAADNWLNELFKPKQIELFDAIVLSYEVGAAKPDSVMYNTVARRLGVNNDECLFIDDLEGYCQAAESTGMKAIHHKDTNETITRIKEILGA